MEQKNKKQNAIRIAWWILVMLVVCAGVWYLTTLLGAVVMYSLLQVLQISVNKFIPSIILFYTSVFIIPCIAIFFTSRYITAKLWTPKYINITAWLSVIICALWSMMFLYAMAHIAY